MRAFENPFAGKARELRGSAPLSSKSPSAVAQHYLTHFRPHLIWYNGRLLRLDWLRVSAARSEAGAFGHCCHLRRIPVLVVGWLEPRRLASIAVEHCRRHSACLGQVPSFAAGSRIAVLARRQDVAYR